MTSKTHHIKIAPKYFNDVQSGKKPFECRKNDRDYQVGDALILREWLPGVEYTGRELTRKITYVLNGGVFGILEGYCVIGMREETIETEPVKHGKWEQKHHVITLDNMTLCGTYPTCNLCGHAEVGMAKNTNYCPNCGADMREEME